MLSLDSREAKKYFMEAANYFTVPLPPYFDFGAILKRTEDTLRGHALEEFYSEMRPESVRGVNYSISASKDGGYAWRTFQLIHPAVYVELTRLVTENWDFIQERFRLYQAQSAVLCVSVGPGAESGRNTTASSILKWWNGIEQGALKMSLYYNWMAETDIQDCYDSIGVDLVEKALSGGGEISVGRQIAKLLSCANCGRPVGVPQGSALVDYVVEVVMGYLDVVYYNAICNEVAKSKYTIFRFRDDYRIFARDEETVKRLVRILSETLARFGLKLNARKTSFHSDIVNRARKADKGFWEMRRAMVTLKNERWPQGVSVQKELLAIYEMSLSYPNSGSVLRALTELYEERIIKIAHRPGDIYPLLGVVANILVKNPRTAQICTAIFSKLLSFNPGVSRNTLVDLVLEKARVVPNTEYMELCLQRLTVKNKPGKKFRSGLTRLVYDQSAKIWNSEWLAIRMRDSELVDHKIAKAMDFVVPVEEVKVFDDYLGKDEGMEEFLEFVV